MERSLLRRAFTFMLVLASAVGADLQTIVIGEGGDNWGGEGDITHTANFQRLFFYCRNSATN